MILMRNFFEGLPADLMDAARIDGANEWVIFGKIVLPLSMPIIATIGVMYGVGHWNEYLSGVIYVNRPELRTLQVVLREVLSRNTEAAVDVTVPTKTLQMAGVVFTSVPIIVVYPFLQKYFTQGIMLGAIKG
jgi:putative aldouronate transport system permease protein